MKVRTAARRVRNRRYKANLMIGDIRNHRPLNRARREESKALARSWEPMVEPEERYNETTWEDITNITFRVVVITQVYENYATHACNHSSDEECTCGSHWKAKGGNEYQTNVGSASNVQLLGKEGIGKIVSQMRERVERCDRFYNEYIIDWMLVPSNEKTPEEFYLSRRPESALGDFFQTPY